MASFDPAKSLLRLFYQAAEGLMPTSGGRDVMFSSEGFASTPGVVERTAISPVALAALRGKTANGPTFAVDAINPDDPGIASLFLLDWVTSSIPVAGVNYHDFDASAGDDPNPGTAFIAAKIWRDGLLGHRFIDGLITGSTISFGENALVGCSLTMVAAYGDYWDEPVHTAGAGTGTLRLRGILGAELNGGSVVVEVVDDAPLTVKAKMGGGVYSSNQVWTADFWKRLNGDGDLLLGDLASPLELYVTGAVAAGDIYTFTAIDEPWVPTLADPDNVVSEVYSSVLVDGLPFVLKSGTLAQNRPAEPIQGFGGVRNAGTRRSGPLTPVLSFTRDALDETVRKHLETGVPFDFQLNLYSATKIGATAFNYGVEILLEGLRMSGPTPVVTSGTARQQDQVTTTGGTLTARVINSQASII